MTYLYYTGFSRIYGYWFYIGDYHIECPFALREAMPHMPLFSRADYLMFIKDGNGLNPLLQLLDGIHHYFIPRLFAFMCTFRIVIAYSERMNLIGHYDSTWVLAEQWFLGQVF